jgi:hypothetical protein
MPVRTWWSLARRRSIVVRALKTSAVIGTILVAINHGDAILSGEVDRSRVLQMLLTYLVPYCVATYAAVGAILDADARARSRA